METCLCGDVDTCLSCFSKDRYRFGCGQMDDMQVQGRSEMGETQDIFDGEDFERLGTRVKKSGIMVCS